MCWCITYPRLSCITGDTSSDSQISTLTKEQKEALVEAKAANTALQDIVHSYLCRYLQLLIFCSTAVYFPSADQHVDG